MQTHASSHGDDPGTARASGRRLPVGAEVWPGGKAHFRVWAPKCQRMEVVIAATQNDAERRTELQSEANGYHSGLVERVVPPMLYGLRCNGGDRVWPDPASRFQPHGPAGLSQLVDPASFP